MNFTRKISLSAGFSLKNFLQMAYSSWYTSTPSSLRFESFTACKCVPSLTCFSMVCFTAIYPLIHLLENFLVSLILGFHFLQSEHQMQQTLYSMLMSKPSFSWNSFSLFLSVFAVVVFLFEAFALIMKK